MSFSEFSEEDFEIIRRDCESLMEVASKRCRNTEELAVVQKAFDFANEAHKNVRRHSGEPYMIHPIAVAKIVVLDIGLGYKSIAAALLHDVVEDHGDLYDLEKLSAEFSMFWARLLTRARKSMTVSAGTFTAQRPSIPSLRPQPKFSKRELRLSTLSAPIPRAARLVFSAAQASARQFLSWSL